MSDTIKLNESLIQLEEELSNIATANKLIQIAKETSDKEIAEVKAMINTLMLDSKNLVDSAINTANQLVTSVNEKSDKNIIESKRISSELLSESRKMVSETIDSSNKLNESAQQLLKTVDALRTKIESVDFPSRLTKIDDSITGININVANVHSGINSLERNLKDEFKNKTKDILHELEKNKTESEKKLSNLKTVIQVAALIQIILISLILAKTLNLL